MTTSDDSRNPTEFVSKATIDSLVDLRRHLHQIAELSGQESNTAKYVRDFLKRFQPDELITDIGGHGLAAIYRGQTRDGAVLLRADLDALPIPESLKLDHSSTTQNVSHKCGHDGHIAMLAGVAGWLVKQKDRPTDVVLLFQPSEETGQGANKVLHDSRFVNIKPSLVFALHNLPGFPLGQIVTSDTVFASSSSGLVIDLLGRTSHAAEPQSGNSPAAAVAMLIQGLGAIPQNHTGLGEAAKVTVVHAKLGQLAFGTSPGTAKVAATLRAHHPSTMVKLKECCENYAIAISKAEGLECRTHWEESFPVTQNDSEATDIIIDASKAIGVSNHRLEQPFPWSEDFGHFTDRFKGALFGLGAGEGCPALHNPEYDFPDALIPTGTNMFVSIIKKVWSLTSDV